MQKAVSSSKIKKLGFVDIRKAYFHAPVKRLVYVHLPEEFCEPGEYCSVCGRLNFSLYGTRDAASNWEECYSQALIELGFKQGLSSPCVFHHPTRGISTMVHGGDFTSLGVESEFVWLRASLESKILIKDRGILGPEAHHLREFRLLSCIITCTSSCIQYEAHQRHSEIIMYDSNLESSNTTGLDTPYSVDRRLVTD